MFANSTKRLAIVAEVDIFFRVMKWDGKCGWNPSKNENMDVEEHDKLFLNDDGNMSDTKLQGW